MDLNQEPIICTFDENTMQDHKGKELTRLRYKDFHGVDSIALCRGDLSQALLQALPACATLRLRDNCRGEISFGKGEHCLDQLGYSYAAYDVDAVDDQSKLQSSCDSFASPKRIDNFYYLRNERVVALHIWRNMATQPQDRELRFKVLRDITKGAPPLVTTILDRAEKSGSTPIIDTLTMVNLKQWSKGRILLLGDSAHCLSLISGQGACMALASAELLSVELTNTKDVAQALVNHEKKLRPIIEKLQERTRKMAGIYIPTSLLKYHLRNMFLKLMPYSWIVSWHVKNIRCEAVCIGTK
ncbi:unnamed protein product [Clonostachys chloroleuca]|uniref:FAD-binding domain-containing protein n=1 Tax=Clonostachys chloroleuca TaxID=1926264 RepID=A0AA35LTA1_9HYPO|nr:unnamed protein product [Clonostachys chloroleuca]